MTEIERGGGKKGEREIEREVQRVGGGGEEEEGREREREREETNHSFVKPRP